MSAVTAIYHIVINTHAREMTLPLASCDQLYRYIARVIQSHNSILYAINGIENHIHLLIHLHPSVCLSDLVRDIKLSTNQWIKQNHNLLPMLCETKIWWPTTSATSGHTISESPLKMNTVNILSMLAWSGMTIG